jgi:hypothetical protein
LKNLELCDAVINVFFQNVVEHLVRLGAIAFEEPFPPASEGFCALAPRRLW